MEPPGRLKPLTPMNPRSSWLVVFATAAALLASTLPSQAIPYSIVTNTTWSTAGTWSPNFTTGGPGGLPDTNNASTIISFNSANGANYNITNDYTTVVLNQLILASGRTANLYGQGTLVFVDNEGAMPAVSNSTGSGLLIYEALNLTTSTVFRTAGAGQITALSNISGAGSVVISNTGTALVRLSASNSFSGGLTLAAGSLDLRNASALGTGMFTIGPATTTGATSTQFLNASTADIVMTTSNTTWNSGFTFIGTKNLTFGPGTVTLGTNVMLTVSSSTLTVPGAITGAWAIVKDGIGSLVLSGINTYTGGTTVSNGTLLLTNSGTVGSGKLTLAGGTFDTSALPGGYSLSTGMVMQGSSAWKGRLNIGSDGDLMVTGANATVGGLVTNAGSVRVLNSMVTWQSNVVLNAGSYTFAGATNTFASGLNVASTAVLGGSGRVVNNGVTNAGTLAPGNSPGTMTFSSNLTLLGTSKLVLEIGSNGLDYDHLIVEGTLTKGGTVLVTNLGYTFVGGEVFNFIDATNWSGSFNLLSLPSLSGGMTWYTDAFETEGLLSVIAIPEPSAILAVGAGLVLMALFRARSRKA